ncbi:pantothenate kinase [Bradyrhizobium sp. S3.12.5]|uniref:hypothetical protein n=1 Tax=Bradyrhizobium sp. S3.12.5 TaxID=3156386 RepID=UPI003395FF6B
MRYRSSKPVLVLQCTKAAAHRLLLPVTKISQQHFVASIGSVWTTTARSTYFATGISIRGLCVRYIIAISGPVAVGKSALADELLKRFSSHRIKPQFLE